MSNGNAPEKNLKNMKIVMEAEGYSTSVTEWKVPEELVRPYAIAYNAYIAKGGLEISQAIYDAMIEGGDSGVEAFAAKVMATAVS